MQTEDKVICEECGSGMNKVAVKESKTYGTLTEKRIVEMYYKCLKCGNKR